MRLLAWGLLMLAGCGPSGGGSGFTVPRGATLSVRTSSEIASDAVQPGSAFRGEIDLPVRQGLTTYIPLGSRVDGVADESTVLNGDPPRARLTLRLTKLYMPDGKVLPLDTVPLTYESKAEVQVNQVTITTGLDVDLDRLLGRPPKPPDRSREPGPRVEIPRNAPLVFTLSKALPVPAP